LWSIFKVKDYLFMVNGTLSIFHNDTRARWLRTSLLPRIVHRRSMSLSDCFRKRLFPDTSKDDKKIALEDNATDITKPDNCHR
jgi:hypothetical protein